MSVQRREPGMPHETPHNGACRAGPHCEIAPVSTFILLQHTELSELQHEPPQQTRIPHYNLGSLALLYYMPRSHCFSLFSIPHRFRRLPKWEIKIFNSVILTNTINNKIVTAYFRVSFSPRGKPWSLFWRGGGTGGCCGKFAGTVSQRGALRVTVVQNQVDKPPSINVVKKVKLSLCITN
jgi:hypothetical protein